MTKRKSYRKVLYLGVLFALLACAMVFIPYAGGAQAALSPVELESEYLIGTRLVVPEATFSLGGESLATSTELAFPDGTVTSARQVTLDKTGNYRLTYRALKDGAVYSEEKQFSVYSKLYEVGSSQSSVRYGQAAAAYAPDGLNVNLYSGDVFKYNKVLDLSGNTATDDFLKISIVPSVIGQRDCDELFIMLTDAYDAENVLTISCIGYPVRNVFAGYLRSAAPGQQLSGYEQRNNHVCVGDEYGFPNYVSFEGKPEDANKQNLITLRYDHQTLQLHSDPRNGNTTMIADHDDRFFFPNAWDGFTTGEVYLSIKCGSYVKNSAGFVITQIGDEILTAERADDTQGPNIYVDYAGYSPDTVPEAEVGRAYKVFDATAMDAVSGATRVDVNVYTNYYSSAKKSIVCDGAFTPASAQLHYIEYRSRDGGGCETTVVVPVAVRQTVPATRVTVSSDRTVAGSLGEKLYAAAYTADGGSGTPSVAITVQKGDDVVNVEPDGSFRIYETGTWEVVYTATDYIGKTTIERYSLDIAAGNKAVFLQEPVLPKYFIAGYENPLPAAEAQNYTGTSGVEISVSVQENGGAEKAVDGFSYRPGISSGMVTVTYTATIPGGDPAQLIYRDIPVISALTENGVNMADYFYKTDITAETLSDSIEFSAAAPNARMEFVNPLLSAYFEMQFSFNAEKNATSLTLYLEDSLDPTVSLKLSYKRQADGKAAVVLNDGTSQVFISEAGFADGNRFNLKYSEDSLAFTVDETKTTNVIADKTLAGETFNGFPSGKIYLSFVFDGEGATGLRIRSLNKQRLTAQRDNGKPEIHVVTAGNEALPGQTVTIPATVYADVLDPGPDCTVTVRSPQGEIVSDVDGVRLENVSVEKSYTIQVSEYGNYEVAFYAVDAAGQEQTDRFYVIRVVDRVSPTIELNGAVAESYAAGDIYLPTATATDNLDKEISVLYYLVDNNGLLHRLTEPNINIGKAGHYTIRYMAYDTAGNLSVSDYTFTVA